MLNIRRKDIIILTIAAVFLGIFIALQYSIIKPSKSNYESSDTMAVEIERLAKNNADMKNQLTDLTKKYQSYKESLNNQSGLETQISKDLKELEIINASTEINGQGVEIDIDGKMVEAQIIDLINAIKNIGADAISINGRRFDLYTSINQSNLASPYKIEIIGNSAVLEGALNRKGGIIDQLRGKSLDVVVSKKSDLLLSPAEQTTFKYAKIISN